MSLPAAAVATPGAYSPVRDSDPSVGGVAEVGVGLLGRMEPRIISVMKIINKNPNNGYPSEAGVPVRISATTVGPRTKTGPGTLSIRFL